MSYEFIGNGSLNFEYVEQHILNKEYIRIANEYHMKKREEGITKDNFGRHIKFPIRSLYGQRRNGTAWENLRDSLIDNSKEFKQFMILIAKTYGVKKIAGNNEEDIFRVAAYIMSTPFLMFIIAIIYDGYNLR